MVSLWEPFILFFSEGMEVILPFSYHPIEISSLSVVFFFVLFI